MKLTPMLQQYLEVKERFPDAILFYRMGDFYEMFFEDAIVVSREVGLTLTSRNKGSDDEVPMAGMPHHSSQSYVAQLIEKGFTVAICEQIEDPAEAKGSIVKRDVVRVVTPGVVLDADNLEAGAPNYFAAVAVEERGQENTTRRHHFALVYLDISTGAFWATELDSIEELGTELARIEAREVLVEEGFEALFESVKDRLKGTFFRARKDTLFNAEALFKLLDEGVRLSEDLRTDGYYMGSDEVRKFFDTARQFDFSAARSVERALSAALGYLVETQRGIASHVQTLEPYRSRAFLIVDEATRANLELTQTMMGGKRSGSLLSVLDKTSTAMGARRLRHWLHYPLVDPIAIEARLDAVEEFVKSLALRQDVRGALGQVYDIERLCGKISTGSAHARDLRSLQSTLAVIPSLQGICADAKSGLLKELAERLDPLEDLCALIDDALIDEPPIAITDGGLFKKGYSDELDELIELTTSGKDWMLRFERQEKERTGISSLKVKYNKVFGYYIEVTRSNLDHVPDDYIRKQTLTNAERYFTPELKEMEERILGADDQKRQLEYRLFEDLRRTVGDSISRLLTTAQALADLDVLAGLGELAQKQDYCRPTLDGGKRIHIVEGRHPVVESTLSGERFVPNSVDLDGDASRLSIITGPNMAGKSTVIRQVALITLLAQMGSFVPAKEAHIGVVDKIFSRVGASDNLARGHSTFMVEMTETAHILNNATDRSLIILDEIGRGTSTFDGLSIAWAVAEHLHDTIKAKTLFATHYHELTELVRTLEGVRNLSIAVKEWNDEIIFLRKLVEGQANRSYGIQVGRLAGLPQAVVDRAKRVLENLEAGQFDDMGLPIPGKDPAAMPRAAGRHNPNQLTLFASAAAPPRDPRETEVLDRLRDVDVNSLTPIEALNLLSQLTKNLKPL